MEDLDAVAQAFGKRRRADGQDHELLDVDAVVGVRPAVDDVHHRQRHHVARLSRAEQLVQLKTALRGVRFRVRERHGQDRVGAEPRLGARAVELDEPPVELSLRRRIDVRRRPCESRR